MMKENIEKIVEISCFVIVALVIGMFIYHTIRHLEHIQRSDNAKPVTLIEGRFTEINEAENTAPINP